ncbi:hypothetical protein [Mesonia sp. K7]|uniref:hypothetical protein n=1 Tax=Mesonia sp. K7 TaxID=2218606 RepID=UPI000DAA1438|nr:hypothetical protein [Mesonia sp. K7]PZD78201.1 hypothetical protein DNG35_05730 [Mesonia sp. K7]
MKLIHRIGYYSIGLFFGIIILIFFLGGKKTSCDYGPNARVLKSIKNKEKTYSPETLLFFNNNDTTNFHLIFENGEVNFNESEVKKDTCSWYVIEGKLQAKAIALKVENCDSIAKIQQVSFKN